MKELFQFFNEPGLDPASGTFSNNLARCFKAIWFLFLIRLLLAVIIFIEKKLNVEGIAIILKSHELSKQDLNSFLLLTWIAVGGPLIEEIAFRGLFSKNRQLIVLSISTFIVVLLNVIYAEVSLFKNIASVPARIIVSGSLVLLLCQALSKYKEQFFEFILKNLKMLVYTSSVLFGLVHLVNYSLPPLSLYQTLMLPVAMLPYLSLGFVFSFLRIKAGLIWSTGFHITNNVLFLSLALSF